MRLFTAATVGLATVLAIPNPFSSQDHDHNIDEGSGSLNTMVDTILDPVFEDYPLVEDRIKNLISRSFNEVRDFRAENFRQKGDKPNADHDDDIYDDDKAKQEKLEKVKIRKLFSMFPESKKELAKVLRVWRKNYGDKPIDMRTIIGKLKNAQRPLVGKPVYNSKPNYRPSKPDRKPYKPQRPSKPYSQRNKPGRPTGLNLPWTHLSVIESHMGNEPANKPKRPSSPTRPDSPSSPETSIVTSWFTDIEPEPERERYNRAKPSWYNLLSNGGLDAAQSIKLNGQNRPQRPSIPIRHERPTFSLALKKPNKPSKNPPKRPKKGKDKNQKKNQNMKKKQKKTSQSNKNKQKKKRNQKKRD